MSQCISCRKDIPENSAVCPYCGLRQMHSDSEKSAKESSAIMLDKYPKMKGDDISSIRNKIEAAFKDDVINETQRESLVMVLDAIESLNIGQQLILAHLITELASKIDSARREESARLLKRYLKTLDMRKEIIDRLSDAFGIP